MFSVVFVYRYSERASASQYLCGVESRMDFVSITTNASDVEYVWAGARVNYRFGNNAHLDFGVINDSKYVVKAANFPPTLRMASNMASFEI